MNSPPPAVLPQPQPQPQLQSIPPGALNQSAHNFPVPAPTGAPAPNPNPNPVAAATTAAQAAQQQQQQQQGQGIVPNLLPFAPQLGQQAPWTANAGNPGNASAPAGTASFAPNAQLFPNQPGVPPQGQVPNPNQPAQPHLLHPAPNMAATATTNASLAYLNDRLARFAAAGGMPFNSRPMEQSASATTNGMSAPGSGASSPGGRNFRTGYSTPGMGLGPHDPTMGFSPLAPTGLPPTGLPQPSGQGPAHGHSSRNSPFYVNGKRLVWSDMICATIAESPQQRLVIQDLFHDMCQKFPEIHEWANGKDWEARVKNRIKSTLSIKSNLFLKVPRPASAAGKGSWWTLSEEAHELYRSGRLSTSNKQQGVLQSATHHVGHAYHHGPHAHLPPRSTSAASHRKEGRAHNPSGHHVGADGPRSAHSSRPNSRTGSPSLSRRSPRALGPMGMTALRPNDNGAAGGPASGLATPAMPPFGADGPAMNGMPSNGSTPLPGNQLPDLGGFNPLTMASRHADGLSSPFGAGTMTPSQGLGLDGLSLGALLPPPVTAPDGNPQSQQQPQQSNDEAARWRALFEDAPLPLGRSPATSPQQATVQPLGDSPTSSALSGLGGTASGPISDPSSATTSAPASTDPPFSSEANHTQADALLRSLGVNDTLFSPEENGADPDWARFPSFDLTGSASDPTSPRPPQQGQQQGQQDQQGQQGQQDPSPSQQQGQDNKPPPSQGQPPSQDAFSPFGLDWSMFGSNPAPGS